MALGEHLGQFVADALAGDLVDLMSEALDGRERLIVNLVAEASGKADGAQHAQLVFTEGSFRWADGADYLVAQVLLPANIGENFVCGRIEEQAVDGEIAALDVLLRFLRVGDL